MRGCRKEDKSAISLFRRTLRQPISSLGGANLSRWVLLLQGVPET